MMLQHDPWGHTFIERRAQIVVLIIINQRAGVYPHLPILLEHKFCIGAHIRITRRFGSDIASCNSR